MNAVAPGDSADFGESSQAQLIRRLVWRLLPFLMLCYLVAWLNRVNISFAALQMNPICISRRQYGLGAGLFFVTYSLLEVPSNLMLYRFGARRWIARIMASWGICAVAMAFVKGPTVFICCGCCWAPPRPDFTRAFLFSHVVVPARAPRQRARNFPGGHPDNRHRGCARIRRTAVPRWHAGAARLAMAVHRRGAAGIAVGARGAAVPAGWSCAGALVVRPRAELAGHQA